jgi:glycosyltransferase involved in cell wall biosynthesis
LDDTMPQLRALFLSKFSELNAACRYRMAQYFPLLRSAGIECDLEPLLPDEYIHRIYGSGSRKTTLTRLSPLVARSLLRRWRRVRSASMYDVVYLQYEALPYVPFWLESSLFRSGAGVVVDFDDAVNLTYEDHPNPVLRRLLGSKIQRVTRASRQVTVANRHMAEWAGRFNPRVTILPNSVDLERYPLDGGNLRRAESGVPLIGWIGTPVTAQYLQLVAEPLRRLRSRFDFRLRVIGAPDFRMDGVDVEAVPWSEATEVALLQECDIGVMPLSDDSWSRGKSALKLIQYMSAGIAAVASPVGANVDVLRDGRNGFLAATEDEWVDRLSLLLEDGELRRRLAESGRRTVEESFSLQRNAQRLERVLRAAGTP